ncbi:MAG: IclR family transcriptional regulator [Paenalcaligenes sp.]
MQKPIPSVTEKNRRGIQSIEIGSELLNQLAQQGTPLPLKDLASAAGMSTSKAHPYMVSFLKVGFVTQNDAGHYELGPLALQLGLARLRRLDPLREATPLAEALARETGYSVALAVWGNLGATIVRLEEPAETLHVNLRAGTVMSLANTATGRLFAAYLPQKVVEQHLRLEQRQKNGRTGSQPELDTSALEQHLTETRKYGLSRTLGMPIPGIDAFCAPVFDANGHIVLGILIMGPSNSFDGNWDGPTATRLRESAMNISRSIGYPEEEN